MSQKEYSVEENDEVVDAVRRSKVSKLVVEFLQQGGPKPHTVFRLDISAAIKVNDETWMGCRLAMDLESGYEGIFHITPLKYAGSSHAAHAAFEFPIKRTDWTVNDVVSANNILLEFSFRGGFKLPGSTTEYLDGCRDFISQSFIKLHQWGLVGWEIHKIERGIFNSKNLRVEVGKTGFHEIIPYNYTINPNPDGPTLVASLPVVRGKFWDESFRRVLIYEVPGQHPYQLPYTPDTPQEGDVGYSTTVLDPRMIPSFEISASSSNTEGTNLLLKTIAQPIYVWTWWVESKTWQSYEFQREDGGRIHTEASDWKLEQVPYEGKLVMCWMYTSKNTGNRYYTWELGSGTDPKGIGKETGKGKEVRK